eukprot:403375643
MRITGQEFNREEFKKFLKQSKQSNKSLLRRSIDIHDDYVYEDYNDQIGIFPSLAPKTTKYQNLNLFRDNRNEDKKIMSKQQAKLKSIEFRKMVQQKYSHRDQGQINNDYQRKTLGDKVIETSFSLNSNNSFDYQRDYLENGQLNQSKIMSKDKFKLLKTKLDNIKYQHSIDQYRQESLIKNFKLQDLGTFQKSIAEKNIQRKTMKKIRESRINLLPKLLTNNQTVIENSSYNTSNNLDYGNNTLLSSIGGGTFLTNRFRTNKNDSQLSQSVLFKERESKKTLKTRKDLASIQLVLDDFAFQQAKQNNVKRFNKLQDKNQTINSRIFNNDSPLGMSIHQVTQNSIVNYSPRSILDQTFDSGNKKPKRTERDSILSYKQIITKPQYKNNLEEKQEPLQMKSTQNTQSSIIDKHLFRIQPLEVLKQDNFNMFKEILEHTVIPQKYKISEDEVQKANKSEFFKEFVKSHQSKIDKQLQVIASSFNDNSNNINGDITENNIGKQCKDYVKGNSPIKINKKGTKILYKPQNLGLKNSLKGKTNEETPVSPTRKGMLFKQQ